MKTLSSIVTLLLAVVIVGNVSAAEKKAAKKAPEQKAAKWEVPAWLKDVNLTDAQKQKIQDLDKELAPKRQEIAKKMQDILTPEQKKAQADAMKAAKAEGKKGKAAQEAVAKALNLTDDQKAKRAEIQKEAAALAKEMREKVATVLTPEQVAQLKAAHKGHGKKAKQEKKNN